MTESLLDANLIKKLSSRSCLQLCLFPTCDHWDFNFNGEDYKNALLDWLPE